MAETLHCVQGDNIYENCHSERSEGSLFVFKYSLR